MARRSAANLGYFPANSSSLPISTTTPATRAQKPAALTEQPCGAKGIPGINIAAADTPARMGGRAALVEPFDRRPIIRPMRRRAHAPPGFGGGGPGACCRRLASIRLLVRVVLIVLVRP